MSVFKMQQNICMHTYAFMCLVLYHFADDLVIAASSDEDVNAIFVRLEEFSSWSKL